MPRLRARYPQCLEGGTFELYEVPCPHRGHMQPLDGPRMIAETIEEGPARG